jgi:hypothetical protein
MVLGGMLEDSELEVRLVQTGLLRTKGSRILLPPHTPSTGMGSTLQEGVSQSASPMASPLNTTKYAPPPQVQKQRSMS